MSRLILFLYCISSLCMSGVAQNRAAAPNPPQFQVQSVHAPAIQPPTFISNSKSNHLQSPAQSAYSHGDPTDQEQLLLEYINRARMNPAAEGDSLYNTKDPDVVSAYNFWKVDKAKFRAEFKTYPARPPLAFHPKAIVAARVHSADMRDRQFQDHTGSDGSNPGQRMSKAGYTTSAWGENIFAYAHSMWEAECGFLVDWGTGNEGLGHRHNTLNFAASDQIYTEIGIGVYAGSGSVGPWVVTEDFGVGFERYIVGVVYKDKNHNNMYDAGEGVSGVKITPSQGNYFAISSTSGGYAIPMGSASGSVSVSAVGAGISENKSVNLQGKNVKLDFGQATTPGVILVYPEDNATVSADTTKLRWLKTTGAASYHIQIARDDQFKKLVRNDSAVASKDTVIIQRGLDLDSVYYWRVRAKSSTLGWGDFSPPYQFTVSIFPSVVALIEPAPKATLKDKNISFKWTQSKPGVTKYWFEITRDTALMDLAVQNYDVTDTTWTLVDSTGAINKDTVYYWHVAAYHNDNVYSAFSELRWFMISSGPNGVNENEAIVLKSFGPNPVRGTLLLQYSTTTAGEVHCALFDERGAEVAPLFRELVDAGDHSVSLDFSDGVLSSLPTGRYFMRYTNGAQTFVRKLIIER